MAKPKMAYFPEADILHIVVSEEEEADSFEIKPNVTAELNGKGDLIGIEILNASEFVRDAALRTLHRSFIRLAT